MPSRRRPKTRPATHTYTCRRPFHNLWWLLNFLMCPFERISQLMNCRQTPHNSWNDKIQYDVAYLYDVSNVTMMFPSSVDLLSWLNCRHMFKWYMCMIDMQLALVVLSKISHVIIYVKIYATCNKTNKYTAPQESFRPKQTRRQWGQKVCTFQEGSVSPMQIIYWWLNRGVTRLLRMEILSYISRKIIILTYTVNP